MKLGFFDFLKKNQKKESADIFPIVVKTENVNESLLKVSSTYNIPLSSLDFDILDYKL